MKQPERPPAWERWLDHMVLALGRTPWGRSGYGRPHGLMRLFAWIEKLLLWGHHVAPLQPDGIVRYEVGPFPGSPIVRADGTVLRRGETAILLHWNNRVLASLEADSAADVQALTWQLAKRGAGDLQRLAGMVRNGTIPAGARTVWAETVHYHMLPRYGFTSRPAPRSFRTPWARLFMLCMLSIYSRPGQLDDIRARERLRLGEGWMSAEDLLRRYPARDRGQGRRVRTGGAS